MGLCIQAEDDAAEEAEERHKARAAAKAKAKKDAADEKARGVLSHVDSYMHMQARAPSGVRSLWLVLFRNQLPV